MAQTPLWQISSDIYRCLQSWSNFVTDTNGRHFNKEKKIISDHTNIFFAGTENIAKASTGIAALDNILLGGFPENRTTLIKGEAGSGKTLIGLQYLYDSAAIGDAVLFVSFEESAAAVRRNALTVGMDINALEQTGHFFLGQAAVDHALVKNGDYSIDALLHKTALFKPDHLVVDSICRTHLKDNHTLEIIDVFENHAAAMAENILLVPTLVIDTPCRGTIVGSLENERQVLTALGIR